MASHIVDGQSFDDIMDTNLPSSNPTVTVTPKPKLKRKTNLKKKETSTSTAKNQPESKREKQNDQLKPMSYAEFSAEYKVEDVLAAEFFHSHFKADLLKLLKKEYKRAPKDYGPILHLWWKWNCALQEMERKKACDIYNYTLCKLTGIKFVQPKTADPLV